MSKIGFIGLGAMGGGMALNLATKAKDVMVFDIRPEACEATVKAGATRAIKLEDMAACITYRIGWKARNMTKKLDCFLILDTSSAIQEL